MVISIQTGLILMVLMTLESSSMGISKITLIKLLSY